MSSDREKFECLKVWKAVGDYIFEDKRDSRKLKPYLQKIVSEPYGLLLFTNENEWRFIEDLKTKTRTGIISWKFLPYQENLFSGGSKIDYLVYEDGKVSYSVGNPNQDEMQTKFLHIWDRADIKNQVHHAVVLDDDDLKFFSALFKTREHK